MSTKLPIAVDAMGGDKAPGDIVAGAIAAQAQLGVPIALVGDPDALAAAGIDTGGLHIFPASEVIGMADDPGQSVRRKKDSSLVRAAEACRDGHACAMVSAGNTGATMASALLRMGRLPQVIRPAIATPLPRPSGGHTVLLDAGANAECTSAMLVQFAQMGSAFARARFGLDSPRVGLLSIGEEPGKGDALRKETYYALEGQGVNFIGNVEGRDILTGEVDVVVTDGFTGNVTLKSLEGAMRTLSAAVMEVLLGTEEARVASAPLLDGFLGLASRLDPDTTGGAMLLGVKGVCIISHGSSSAQAMVNACRVAASMVDANVVAAMAAAVATPHTAP